MICSERFAENESLFWSENNEDWTQEWREELTAEEASLVDKWDDMVAGGMYRLAKRILDLEKKRRDGATEKVW